MRWMLRQVAVISVRKATLPEFFDPNAPYLLKVTDPVLPS